MRQIFVYDHDLRKVVPRGSRAIDREPRIRGKTVNVISDVEPFQSPIDKSWLGSRTDIREHQKKHNVVQVGNDFNNLKPEDYKQNDYLKQRN